MKNPRLEEWILRLNRMRTGIGFMKMNDSLRVKYIGEDDPMSLRTGKIYNARILEKGWYGIVDESGEEYAYHPGAFEIVTE